MARLVVNPQKLVEIRAAIDADQYYGQNTDGADEPDRTPVAIGDPNNDIDPDDQERALVIASLPEMPPCAWWIRMTLDPPDTVVTPEDVRLVFRHIRYQLAGQEASTGTFPPSQDATAERLLPSEAGDSGPTQSSATVGVELNSITTVGQLHERVEELFGSLGWAAFVELWQTACSIEPPAKRETREAIRRCASDAPAEPHGKPDQALPPLPADAPVLEEGLHRELEGMPVKVQAFFLHSPKDPPAWRHVESESERGEREFLQDQGCWPGG